MGAFVCPVIAQQKLPVGHALFGTRRRFTVGKKPLEQRKVQGLQPFALIDAPALVAAFQQIPAVERNDPPEHSGISGIEPFPRNELDPGVGLLQVRHVEP